MEKTFVIQSCKIKIRNNPLVFHPSPHGTRALGENIEISKGEKVLDVGTGSGILAILAAKKGGIVFAVDILDDAIKCAKHNALLNLVNIRFIKSDLFAKVPNKNFDVIVANVPQELLSPKIIRNTKKEIVIGMHGFGDGSAILIRTLRQAKKFMTSKTRLFVVVYTMSGWRKSLKVILKNYDARLLDLFSGEVKNFVYNDLGWYKKRSELGLYAKGGKYWADLFVFELKLKSRVR